MSGTSVVLQLGPLRAELLFRNLKRIDQGVSIRISGGAFDGERELLRFDCYDERAHYHYDPRGRNERIELDRTLVDEPLDWALGAIRSRLPAMLARAGAAALATDLNVRAAELDALEAAALEMDRTQRRRTVHVHGDELIQAGELTFGLQCVNDGANRGVSIHVIAEVDGRALEIICFDCYQHEPHYHYSPMKKEIVLPLDPAVVPDPLEWALEQIRLGKLPRMIERAGYPELAKRIDGGVVARQFELAVAPRARLMLQRSGWSAG